MDFSKLRSINLPSCYPASSRTRLALDLVHIFTSCLKKLMTTQCQLCLVFRTEWCSPCRQSTIFWCTTLKASCQLRCWKAFTTIRLTICHGWARRCSWLPLVMVFALSFNWRVELPASSWKATQPKCRKISRSIIVIITRWTSNLTWIRRARRRIKDLPK